MARPKKKRKAVAAPSPPPVPDPPVYLALAFLSIAAVVCFFPVLRYFLAQDDFVLMHIAWRDGWAAVGDFFSRTPGHFRPLTKAAWFSVMYRVFGLNAAPWHVMSIAVHIVNINLFYLLMRRVGIKTVAALASTALFGLSVSFLHVIAWAACIQQLLGMCFMLAAFVWGIDYVRSDEISKGWLSLAAYALALGSIEQTFGLPVLLAGFFLLAPANPGDSRSPSWILRKLSAHLSLMVLYLAFMVLWKTTPETGYYAFVFGPNIFANLAVYLGWSVQFWAALPSRMALGRIPWSATHIVVAVIVVVNLLRGRRRETAFGLLFFLVTISPTLFLKDHTFYMHTYVPAFGVLYLIAAILQDVLDLPGLRSPRAANAVLAVVLVSVAAGSFEMVRRNQRYRMFDMIDMPRSFVLRRAEIAENVYRSIGAKKPFDETVEKVYFVYGRPEGREEAKWNRSNVEQAIGRGSLINLIYERPEIEVVFGVAGDQVAWDEQYIADIYFYDDFGNCMKMTPEQQAPR